MSLRVREGKYFDSEVARLRHSHHCALWRLARVIVAPATRLAARSGFVHIESICNRFSLRRPRPNDPDSPTPSYLQSPLQSFRATHQYLNTAPESHTAAPKSKEIQRRWRSFTSTIRCAIRSCSLKSSYWFNHECTFCTGFGRAHSLSFRCINTPLSPKSSTSAAGASGSASLSEMVGSPTDSVILAVRRVSQRAYTDLISMAHQR